MSKAHDDPWGWTCTVSGELLDGRQSGPWSTTCTYNVYPPLACAGTTVQASDFDLDPGSFDSWLKDLANELPTPPCPLEDP